MGRIAICTIFKNESDFILEWIAFHISVGFEKFFLYDNGSTDNTVEKIRQFSHIKIFVISWPERPGQKTAYEHFLSNYASECDWIAFIDVDEFIHPLGDEDIGRCLARAGSHPAMLLNWLNFGPSGHRTAPPGLVMENYLDRLPDNDAMHYHVKTIARPTEIIHIGGAHISALKGDPCDATGRTISNDAISSELCLHKLVINHYYTRSEADWIRKVSKGRATVLDSDDQRQLSWFDYYRENANIHDERILRFSGMVKRELGRL